MTYVDWVEIENFKGLNDKVKIPLGNPSVVIGPNNAGKTTVLQAYHFGAVLSAHGRRRRVVDIRRQSVML